MKNKKINYCCHCEGGARGNLKNKRFLRPAVAGLGMTRCVTFYFLSRTMLRKCGTLLVLLVLLFVVAFAVQKQKTYRVWIWQENGDCLWNIAKKFYGDGRKWTVIYEANKDEIDDPKKIYPKQKLIIP